jgi:hypothetical protein
MPGDQRLIKIINNELYLLNVDQPYEVKLYVKNYRLKE